MSFDGFPRGTVRFLAGIRAHSEKEWFEAHRADYEQLFLAPAVAFAEALAPRLRKIEPDVSVASTSSITNRGRPEPESIASTSLRKRPPMLREQPVEDRLFGR